MSYFFTTLGNLNVESLDENIELIPGLIITNSRDVKVRLLNDDVISAIGIIEAEYIINSENLLFYEYEDSYDFEELDVDQYLVVVLVWLEELLKNSWLIKDNCIECESAYLVRRLSDGQIQYSSNSLRSKSSFADGSIQDVVFNKQELISLSFWHNKIESYLHTKESLIMTPMYEKKFSRIGRGLNFIKSARTSRNLAYKIANYCSALEAILTTDTAELAHKLSERVAFFLQDVFSDKLETFKLIKQAYSIRSKLTHGDTIDKNLIDKMPAISESCDMYLRVIIYKIIDDEQLIKLFDGANHQIDDYFNELIFH